MGNSGFTSFVDENKGQGDDEVEVGERNFKMLRSMLKVQMALVNSQGELQREQAGKQLEQLRRQLDYKRECTYIWLRSYLTNRSQFVCIVNERSTM